jgi:hypothetical protein
MLNVFIFLVAEGATGWMWETPSLQAISCPAAISNRKPNKDLAFVRGPRLSQTFPWFKLNGADKRRHYMLILKRKYLSSRTSSDADHLRYSD